VLLTKKEASVVAQPPIPEGRCDCPCSLTCDNVTLTPCEYDIMFTSFTHVDGPNIDKKARLKFQMDIIGLGSGYATRHFNYQSEKIKEEVTKPVNKIVHSIRVGCGSTENFSLKIRAEEKDKFGANDVGTKTLSISLDCSDTSPLLSSPSVLMDLDGKHEVQVNLSIINKTPPCITPSSAGDCPIVLPPPSYDDTPKPCKVVLEGVSIELLDGLTSLYYISIETEAPDGILANSESVAQLGSGLSAGLGDMDNLFQWDIPCCAGSDSCINIPLKINIDAYRLNIKDEFSTGSLSTEITLCCPIEKDVFQYDILGYDENTNYQFKARITLVAKTTTSSSCVIPPLPPILRPCTIQYTLLDIENIKSPRGDRKAEFSFDFFIGGEPTSGWSYDTTDAIVRKGETRMVNHMITTIEIPCFEERILPLEIVGKEHDILPNPGEYAHHSDTIEVKCLHDEVVVRPYVLSFRNINNKVRHKARIRIEERVVNWNHACECTGDPNIGIFPDPQPTCKMEIELYETTHDLDSPGDNWATFSFWFWFNSQAVTTAGDDPDQEHVVYDIQKGETFSGPLDGEFVDLYGSNLLGTYFDDYVQIPIGSVLPLRVDMSASELTSVGDEYGFSSEETKIFCPNPNPITGGYDPVYIDVHFTLKKNNKKIKHNGKVVLRARRIF